MTRELRQIKLHEVSVVTGFPAYTATTAQVRSIDALAQRTGSDVDQLADALTVLEAGMNLSDDQAALLTETVAKLRNDPSAPVALDIKRKQLDLLLNKIN
jgi:diaminopimelate decarboxylase